MKIQLLSDLHLEVHPHFVPQPAPGADLLVLAGDIGSYQTGSQLADADFGLARFSPLQGWPTPVLFLPGFFITFAQGIALPYGQSGAMAVNPKLAGTASGIGACTQNLIGAAMVQLYGFFSDGTVWKDLSYKYLYLYAYSPTVILCPAEGRMTLGSSEFQLMRIR